MTIEDIKFLFIDIYNNNSNILDMNYALAEHEKEYNNSDYAKTTHMSIYEAFLCYYKTALNYVTILSYVQKMLEDLDLSKLKDAFDITETLKNIPEEYKNTIMNLFNSLELK